jgi:hypothetical protein
MEPSYNSELKTNAWVDRITELRDYDALAHDTKPANYNKSGFGTHTLLMIPRLIIEHVFSKVLDLSLCTSNDSFCTQTWRLSGAHCVELLLHPRLQMLTSRTSKWFTDLGDVVKVAFPRTKQTQYVRTAKNVWMMKMIVDWNFIWVCHIHTP